VTCLEVLQNGNMATGSMDASIAIWDTAKCHVFRRYDGHTNQISKIVELMNGNIASASLDKSVNIWDRQSGEILYTLEGFESHIQ
jgi:WD40 repeat protein